MLARGERDASSMRVDPATESERRRMLFIDKSKGMNFDGSTKRCMYRAIATIRSDADSRNRDGGINGRPLMYLACFTTYELFLLGVEHGGGGILPPLSSTQPWSRARGVDSAERHFRASWRFGLACAVLEGRAASLTRYHNRHW